MLKLEQSEEAVRPSIKSVRIIEPPPPSNRELDDLSTQEIDVDWSQVTPRVKGGFISALPSIPERKTVAKKPPQKLDPAEKEKRARRRAERRRRTREWIARNAIPTIAPVPVLGLSGQQK